MNEDEKHRFTVQKVALPPRAKSGREAVYPYQDMEIGDSFFVPNKKHSQLSSMTYYAKTRHGVTLSMRKDVVDGVKGIRLFRIA